MKEEEEEREMLQNKRKSSHLINPDILMMMIITFTMSLRISINSMIKMTGMITKNNRNTMRKEQYNA